jgi:hypothetical protein
VALAAALIAICWIVWAVTWIVTALIFRPPTTDARTPGQVRLRSRSFRLILVALFIAVSSQHVGDVRFGRQAMSPAWSSAQAGSQSPSGHASVSAATGGCR